MDINNKIAVVVGATGGMGSVVSKLLYAEGVKPILVARNEEKLKQFSQEFGNCDYFVCDVSKAEAISQICSQITAKYPVVDYLMNAAGIGVYKAIEDVSELEWSDSFNTNVSASYFFIKYLLPSLKNAPQAAVINWGSGMGVIATPGRSVYCTTKFALRGMSLSLSLEFQRTNIHIVHLTLGSVLTEFGPMTLDQKKEENLQGKSYLTPEGVSQKVIQILKSEDFQDEVELYPTDYEEGIR